MSRRFLFVALALGVSPAWGQPAAGYYRHPALHGSLIVFCTEGDLWTVSTEGGAARRLTTHPGEETHPTISPDGLTVGFTASYEGPAELYTMSIDGGLPTRWTYEAEPSIATTWSPGGELVYTTSHYSTLPDLQLVTLDLDTGRRQRIPLSQASEGTFEAAGETLFFVRPAFHGNVTRRYRGGTARQIWKYAEGAPEAEILTTDYAGESHTPMWWDGRVHFISDRDGTMNVWSMDESGGDLRQHTEHSGWDVRDASLNEGRIVYQVGAAPSALPPSTWAAPPRSRRVPSLLRRPLDFEHLSWYQPAGPRTEAVFIKPSGIEGPLPGILALHDHGGCAGSTRQAKRNDPSRFTGSSDTNSDPHPGSASCQPFLLGHDIAA